MKKTVPNYFIGPAPIALKKCPALLLQRMLGDSPKMAYPLAVISPILTMPQKKGAKAVQFLRRRNCAAKTPLMGACRYRCSVFFFEK